VTDDFAIKLPSSWLNMVKTSPTNGRDTSWDRYRETRDNCHHTTTADHTSRRRVEPLPCQCFNSTRFEQDIRNSVNTLVGLREKKRHAKIEVIYLYLTRHTT
jgi:hypothetical protein